jgi:alanine dehydrogenase
MGAHVTVLDTDLDALQRVLDSHSGVATLVSNSVNIARVCAFADVVVGAILVPDERPPIIISREVVKSMKSRSVLMDISIDEGGCFETSRPTTHEQPTFVDEGVIHYCVPNMPSAVARTATHAFLAAAYPFIQEIASKGVQATIDDNPAIAHGIATHQGEVHHISSISLLS